MRSTAAETDTIAALATPLGEGGLAVIRISGPLACTLAEHVFIPAGRHARKPTTTPSHTVLYGHAVRDGHRLDEVLLTVMRAPRTFTREDVVEVSCHGGVFVTRQILDALLAAGARLAQPGEFTRRAFLNGRLDLTQAEAVADLIHARTELALAAANEQLAGGLSRRIERVRDDLLTVLAHVEAHLDFPDEDIAPDTRETLCRRIQSSLAQLDQLLATAREGRVLRRGIRAAIVGRPNAGKSSLLNALLGHDRAIVSPLPGTTRDTIEETANIRGIPVVFVDTAGLRTAADDLEQEGIRRTHHAAAQADLVLHVLDRSTPLAPDDHATLVAFAARPRVVVINKHDLPPHLTLPPDPDRRTVEVSCATGEGLETLKDTLAEVVWSGRVDAGTQDVTINARHEDAIRRAHASLEETLAALQADLSLELVAVDLRLGLSAVGEVVGRTTTEDLLDAIFSQFCLGK